MTELTDSILDSLRKKTREELRAEITKEVMDAAIEANKKYLETVNRDLYRWMEEGDKIIAMGQKRSILFWLGMWYADRPWRKR